MDQKSYYGRVIPNFIGWGLKAQPLKVNGDGKQIRSFCYIDDFIEGIAKVAQYAPDGVVYNIGNPEPVSIISLANMVNKILRNLRAFNVPATFFVILILST